MGRQVAAADGRIFGPYVTTLPPPKTALTFSKPLATQVYPCSCWLR